MALITVFRSIELILNNNNNPMGRSLTWQKFRPLGPVAKGTVNCRLEMPTISPVVFSQNVDEDATASY